MRFAGRGRAEELAKKQAEVDEHRRVLLSGAEALGASGVLPLDEVSRIRRGRGFIDRANDCVDLAALFRTHAGPVQGKLPFDAARIGLAAAAGTELADYLRPAGTVDRTSLTDEQKDDLQVRDGLWTMIVEGYEGSLWRAGAWLFGSAVNEQVPPLLSRETRRPAKSPPEQ